MASPVTTAHISACGRGWLIIHICKGQRPSGHSPLDKYFGWGTWLPLEAYHDWKKRLLLCPVRQRFLDFRHVPPFFLSFTHTPLSTKMCHSSTPCQHFTDSYRHWGAGRGGEGQECLQEAEKRKRGEGGGLLWDESCYDAAQRERRCQNKTMKRQCLFIFRQFYHLKWDKQ